MANGFSIPIPFFGSITIHFYGVIIMVGAIAAAYLASWQAKRRGMDQALIWDSLLWVLLGGIVGARLWHIFTPPPSMVAIGLTTTHYLTHPLDAIAIWNGGLGLPGAVLGGVLALYLFCRSRKVPFAAYADIAAPALALGQAIGRWGNFVNQELYGQPTSLPWGISITNAPGYPAGTRFHPLFLYESLYNLLNVFFLLYLGERYKDKLKSGDIFLVYLITYPIGRFLLEFIRLDSAQLGGINVNQTIMLIVAITSAGLLLFRHRPKAGPVLDTSAAPESEETQ